jgi:hypothetical protein
MFQRKFSILNRISIIFLNIVLLIVIGILLVPLKCMLTIDVLKPFKPENFQVFFDKGLGFNEADSRHAFINPTHNGQSNNIDSISFSLPPTHIQKLRIDPGTGINVWKLKSIKVEYIQANKILYAHVWTPQDIVRDFQPLHSIDTFSVRDDVVYLKATDVDPYFIYKGNFSEVSMLFMRSNSQIRTVAIACLLLIFFFLNYKILARIRKRLCDYARNLLIPFPENKFIFPLFLWIILILFALFKLWLTTSQLIPAFHSPHDDEFFLRIARHIAAGQWFGQYNNLTLAKAPFYPIWIAVMFWIGIPLSISQNLLYSFSCLFFVIAIRSLLRNIPGALILVYLSLLFHPVSYGFEQLSRVLREAIYPALTILLLGSAIGLLLRRYSSSAVLKKWGIVFGLVLSAFWLTREESVIMLPALVLLLGTSIFSILLFTKDKKQRIAMCCIPFIIFCSVLFIVAAANKIFYGVFTTCEQKQSDFVSAYGALLRVKPVQFQRYIQIPRETRERIYTVSPAFKELRQFIEGENGKAWSKYGIAAEKDISTHFTWAFRDAVSLAGYYTSGDKAAEFYRRLASEVNAACERGTLDCFGRHNSLIPIWRNEYLIPMISFSGHMVVDILTLENIVQPCSATSGPEDITTLFKDMTHDRIKRAPNEDISLPCQYKVDSLKTSILYKLLRIFKFYWFIIVPIGVFFYIAQFIYFCIRYPTQDIAIIVLTSLLLVIISRILLLSFIEVSTWPNMIHYIIYQASLYPVITAFSVLAILTTLIRREG